jgi:hypothetical protein
MASWNLALDYVTDLGITNIRIDFVWKSFNPSRGVTDWNHVAYWDGVVRMARSRGIGIVAILGYLPDWAVTVRDCQPNTYPPVCGGYGSGDLVGFFQSWNGFARFIASRYGQDIQYYQLLNEENHPSHDEFPHTHDGEPRAIYEAYQGLLVGTGLYPESHKSRFKTIFNAWADDLLGSNDWNRWFRDILNDPWGRDSIDIVAIDHYPGTWCCGRNYRDWGALDTLANIARDYRKDMGVMETGFNTFGSQNHYQPDQTAFAGQAMDEVLAKANYYNVNFPANPFVLLSWYEFIDTCTDCVGLENHFGILEFHDAAPQWRNKQAFDTLRYQVSRWN